MKDKITVGPLTASPGERVQGYYPVPGSDMRIPVTVINGDGDGKRVLVTSGVHGGEYPGIQASIELAGELTPRGMQGAVILVHPVNVTGFEAKNSACFPEDGKNLNRLFPGDPNGTLGERVAWCMTEDFHSQADFYIDLHAGNADEELTKLAFVPGACDPEVARASLAAAAYVDVPLAIRSGSINGACGSAAAVHGVPGILLERGGNGIWSRQEVDDNKADVKNLLRYLGVLPGQAEKYGDGPAYVTNALYLNAGETGCFIPFVRAGEDVKKGQLMAEIRDYFGRVLAAYYSEIDGRIFYMKSSLAIQGGHSMIAMGEVPNQ
ncbi:MAG: succinylglutamate desuccinylase/aspartoacylase family protein [Oscillospiraceae bacterium]|nr:succinylglutamate desuccinylase/aspartoacylase family protein [Oscillospiraceae bacterium]